MDYFTQEHLNLMHPGLELFNAQKYWECHESLEHLWLEEPGPIRNIYWAIIQVAAALIHYRDKNPIGAEGLIYKAKNKLLRCEESFVENEFLLKSLNWGDFKSEVKAIPNKPGLDDFKKLFEFRFVWRAA